LVLIELFTRFHYRKSIRENADVPELFKNVFLFYWNEKSQHAIVNELAGMSSLSATHRRSRKLAGGGFARVGVS
jgi:hypothetical protein